MILIVSHYTKNKGTTDFLLDYLKFRKLPYMYLRHPFYSENIRFSELLYWNGKNEKTILKIWKINNPILVLAEDFLISLFVSIKLRKNVDKVLTFGGFNFFPFIFFNSFFKRKLYYWGVDYSIKRFESNALNRLYHYFETVACKFSVLAIQLTPRQEKARVKRHGLDRHKSLILPSGVNFISLNKKTSPNQIALLYIGSISQQHGIVDFIKYFYVNNRLPYKLYIFGGGEREQELKKTISKHSLSKEIIYFGVKNQNEIKQFVLDSNNKLFGLAPYDMKKNDHVYYGDSIKLKEYLSYDIPFITSKVAYVYPDIKKFGFVYDDFGNLNDFFNKSIYNFQFNKIEKDGILQNYLWRNIFDKLYPYLK